jgi:hypothetical protein
MTTADVDRLLTEPKAATAIASYMLKTGLLVQFQYVDMQATGTTEKEQEEGT